MTKKKKNYFGGILKIMRAVREFYKLHIKPHLPIFVQQAISMVRSKIEKSRMYAYLRVQRPVTRFLGPQYHRSRKFIEIDITYACNLYCYNCNRSCTQAPSQEQMTVDQIRQFLDESIAANVRWERIRILGGEPTLHPDLLEIIDMLRSWRSDYMPEAQILLFTNGYGRRVREVLKLIPDDIIIKDTSKENREQLFRPFNIAPSDLIAYRFADFRNGCNVTQKCGTGLTSHGWYPCAIAGAIDRVLGFNAGHDRLPTEDDDMYDQLEKFCSLCGHFIRRRTKVRQSVLSKTWKTAYQNY
ncbi:MAG: radical SAM protein, partial [Nitrososphaeraceae archaeon]